MDEEPMTSEAMMSLLFMGDSPGAFESRSCSASASPNSLKPRRDPPDTLRDPQPSCGSRRSTELASDCGAIDNVISLSFANAHGSTSVAGCVLNICWTAGQESAHAFGLDHEYAFVADDRSACSDPRTYRSDCGGQKFFRNEAARCGENVKRACQCTATQNSHAKLLSVFGAGTPITRPRDVELRRAGAGQGTDAARRPPRRVRWSRRRRPRRSRRCSTRRLRSPEQVAARDRRDPAAVLLGPPPTRRDLSVGEVGDKQRSAWSTDLPRIAARTPWIAADLRPFLVLTAASYARAG